MHEFLVRIRAQLLWAWARLDEAEASARSGIEVLSSYQPQQQLQCLAVIRDISLKLHPLLCRAITSVQR